MKEPKSKFLLVGTGDLLSAVQHKVEALNIGERVIIAGIRNDVYKIYSALDVLIMPSLFEGFPLTAVEAQCSGLNCFLSDSITSEVSISDLINFIGLDSDDKVWAESIIAAKSTDSRFEYYQLVKKQGYDSIEVKKRIVSLLHGDN